jgi:hypothetical protein
MICYEPISNCKKLKHFKCNIIEDDTSRGVKVKENKNINIGMTHLGFLKSLFDMETINIRLVNSLKNIDDVYNSPKLSQVCINAKQIIIKVKIINIVILNHMTQHH